MTIDLIRAFILLWGLVLHGPPDRWDIAIQFALVASPEGLGVEVIWDPVAIYHRHPPKGFCGMSFGQVVFIHPSPSDLECLYTEEHELAHVWQWRGYGLWPFGYSEPPEPWHQIPPAPYVMRHGLIRFSLPFR